MSPGKGAIVGFSHAVTQRARQAGSPDRARRTPSVPAIHGNQARLRRIQAKLAIGPVDDPLEREADRIADQVMRMPTPAARPPLTAAPPQVSRKCAACEEEDKLQKKEAGAATTGLGAAPASIHDVLRSPGQPLDLATRGFMEPRFGHDFSRVRVHSSPDAQQSALDVNAHAYTVGHNIVFGAGKYAPGTNEGRQLLAHELAHVVQQAPASARTDQRTIAAPDGNLEREVVQATESAASNQPICHRSPQGIVQRQMCRDILNVDEVPGVTRGVEIEQEVRFDLISQLGSRIVPGLSIPGASSRLLRMEECGRFQRTQPPEMGFPDLAARNGRNVELAEIKIGTWPCLWLAEEQVDKYVEVANRDKALKRAWGVDEFELMPTSRFTPSQLIAPDGTPIRVGWCSPGVIVYKAAASGRDTRYCGAIPDKGLTDDLLNRLLDPAVELAARALQRRLNDLGLGPVNFRLLFEQVRKRIQDHIRGYLQDIIATLCAGGVAITLAAVLAELRRQLLTKDVVDGLLERFNHPGEGIDIPVGKLAGETALGLAIIGALAELGALVLAF